MEKMMNTVNLEYEKAHMDNSLTGLFQKTEKSEDIIEWIVRYKQVKKAKESCDTWAELLAIMSYTFPFVFFGYIELLINILPGSSWIEGIVISMSLALAVPIVSILLALPLALNDATFPDKWMGKMLCKIFPGFKRKQNKYLTIQKELYAHIGTQQFQYAYLAYLQVQIKQVKALQQEWKAEPVLNQKEIEKANNLREFLENNHRTLVTLLSEEEHYEESFLRAIKNIDECLKENPLIIKESKQVNDRKNFINGYNDFLNKHNIDNVMSLNEKNEATCVVTQDQIRENELSAGLKKHL
jgi:hypothetical protein